MKRKEHQFSETAWDHYRTHGRDMPWRKTRERPRRHVRPYHILVSELMLQQTQVPRVAPKYKEFINHFPGFKALAEASTRDVLAHWKGLGYNRRAVHLKRTAETVTHDHNGHLPRSEQELQNLPGIGPYTVRAILAFAFNAPSVFIETNIRTAFLYHFFSNKESVHDNEIYPLIERTLDQDNPREWYYALMDYGSSLKAAGIDLGKQSKHYTKQSPFKGSNREARSKILEYLMQHGRATPTGIANATGYSKEVVTQNLVTMRKEDLVVKRRKRYSLA